MKVIFLGTPDFAVPVLAALHEAGHEICAVVTQPDKPKGRGKTPAPGPVKQRALELGLDVLQFKRIRDDEPSAALEQLGADIAVTAAFGQILSQRNLDATRLGTVNAHASLLPAYRGPAPANWCIINGEKQAGVTSMHTDAGIDTGDMIFSESIEIGEHETAGELLGRLSGLAAGLMLKTLAALEQGDAPRLQQDANLASYFPMLKKEDGRLDFRKPAAEIKQRTLGVDPWPGAFALCGGEAVKLFSPSIVDAGGQPGRMLGANDPTTGLVIACGDKAVSFAEVQAPGKKRMDAASFLRGRPGFEGFDR